MVVLPWDQEKIVVLNLIVFLYSLYFFVYDSVNSTFLQKKEILSNLLNSDIENKFKLIKNLLEDIKKVLEIYSFFLLSIINKYLNSFTFKSLFNNTVTINFLSTVSVLSFYLDFVLNEDIQKNIFSSKEISFDSSLNEN